MGKRREKSSGLRCTQIAALPWRVDDDGKLRILLVTSRTNGKWMLPKGWPMDGKAAHEAALIEAQQEAGIDGDVAIEPIGSYRYIKLFDDGSSRQSQAKAYPIKVTAVHNSWDEQHQRRRRWVRPKKAAGLVYEPDLKRLLGALRHETIQMFGAR